MNIEETINSLVCEIRNMNENMKGLKADIDGLRADIAGLKTDASGIKADISGLKSDTAGLNSRFDTIEKKQSEMAEEVAEFSAVAIDIKNMQTAKKTERKTSSTKKKA